MMKVATGRSVASALLALGTIALLPGMAAAQTSATGRADGGWYAGLTLIGAYATLDGFSADGTAGATDLEHDDDWVGGGALKVGYRWRDLPVRVELEVAHRYRFDLDAREAAGAGQIDYESNIGTTTALLTALVEWRNSSAFRPFAGLTLGWAHHRNETERTDLVTGASSSRNVSENNFAWGALAGVEWAFAPNWSAEIAYRYMDLGDVTTGTLPGGQRLDADDYVSHDLLLSILYRF